MKVKRAIKYKATCPHCGSQLEFTLDEVHFENSCCSEFGGFVKCPTCNRKVQTHDGFWTSNKYYLLKTVDVIYEEKEFEFRKLIEPDPKTEEVLKKLFEKEEGDEQ